MTRSIIFDFFGVVSNDQYTDWLGKHQFERTDQFADIARRADLDKINMTKFFSSLGEIIKTPGPTVRHQFEETIFINQGVVDLIGRLRSAGYKIGLLSNSNGPWLRGILAEYDLERLFDVIIISGEVGLVKPQPDIFQLALVKLNSKPEETIFIDDRSVHVAAAQSVGIEAIVYQGIDDLQQRLKKLGVGIEA